MPTKVASLISAMSRLAIWIAPHQRQDWVQAMLNECAYIKSRREAVRWAVESLLLAIKERSTYELEEALMNIRALKTVLVLALVLNAAAISAVAGVYSIQKPYQQERIKLVLCRYLDAKQT